MAHTLKKIAIVFAVITTITVLNACEGHSDEFDDNGIDQQALDRTRNEINSEMKKADSLVVVSLREEIALLKEEIALLKEELKKKK